jgi:prephenate dehydrogenase
MARMLPLADANQAAGEPPPFERIGIVGLGLIGGSVALACRRRWPGALVIGVDANGPLEAASARYAIDVGADDLGMLREADLVVLAAPVRANIAVLEQLAEFVPGEAVVTDVGSTKRTTVEAARRLPSRLTFIGGHPLAGATHTGIASASADLFERRPWFLTPPDGAASQLDRLSAWVEGLGGVPRIVDAAAHDELVAFVSHLPQVVSSALMLVVGDAVGTEGLRHGGQGLIDTTRLAASAGSVWTDVCGSNADRLGQALDRLIAELQRTRSSLGQEDVIAQLFGKAAAWRRDLEARTDEP